MTRLTGVILAGGQGSRMAGLDKGLMLLNGLPLYQHVLQRLRPQVDIVMISANRNIDSYQLSGCEVIKDSLQGYQGPLAGMLSALQAATTDWVTFCACDTPFIPMNYVAELWQQKADAPAVWSRSIIRDHPTLSLVHRSLIPALEASMQSGDRRLMKFMAQHNGHAVLLQESERAFRNFNTPDDLQNGEAEQ